MWIDPIFELLKAKTGRDFSVMLLTENELIGSPAEAISLETFGYVPTYSDVTLTQQDGIKVVKLKLG